MDNLAKPQARGWTRLKDSCAMPSTAFCFSLARPANITLRMHSSFLRQPSTFSCRSGTTATIPRTRGIPARWPKSAHAMRAFLLQPNACSMALFQPAAPLRDHLRGPNFNRDQPPEARCNGCPPMKMALLAPRFAAPFRVKGAVEPGLQHVIHKPGDHLLVLRE